MKKKIADLIISILASKPVKSAVRLSKRIVLPGFEGMPFYQVMEFFFTGIRLGRIDTRAQALAFSFFLAIFPAIIFLFSLIPYVPMDNFQEQLLDLIRNVLPNEAYSTIRLTIEDIVKRPRGGLLSIGFLMTLLFTTNGFMTMMRGFNSSYHVVESRSQLKLRWVAIVLTFILSTLVILATLLIIFSQFAVQYLAENNILRSKTQVAFLMIGKWGIVLSLFFFAISFLYYYGPSVHKRWRFVSAGATFATLLSILVSTGFAYYVNHFGQYNKLYGSIGTLIVVMLWIYFNSLSLILGFELNASIDNAKKGVRKVF